MSDYTIALLGQPNTGKSTLFNSLTGSHQRVGNWAGKTVELKEGSFKAKGHNFRLVDLPGAYSLCVNTEEEAVTRDFISEGSADLVVVLADASQLERSMFMLSDYIGINVPCVLLLNLVDIAKGQGKTFEIEKLRSALGIPTLLFNATDRKGYDIFFDTIVQAIDEKSTINETKLYEQFENEFGGKFEQIRSKISPDGVGVFSANWLTTKLIENDREAMKLVESEDTLVLASEIEDGSLHTGNCKFNYISMLLKDFVCSEETKFRLSKFDKFATSRFWGKPFAIFVILIGLLLSMVIGSPLMNVGFSAIPFIANFLTDILTSIGTPQIIISFILDVLITSLGFAMAMAGFIFGVTVIFGFVEEVGYMARISYVFDNIMQKIGLHGKAIMPFLVSFGCNIGGATGARVLDTWGQKVTTIALSWVVPCGSAWAVIALVSSIFFGSGAALVILSLFLVAILHIIITAKVFGRGLLDENDKRGIIMELPPYHKPKWRTLLSYAVVQTGKAFVRGIKIIVPVSFLFWVFAYTPDNDIKNSMIYKVGVAIEPVTMFFGLRWQTFMAWLIGAMGKEGALGAMSALFNNEGIWSAVTLRGFGADSTLISGSLLEAISKPEALAFIYAFFFNMPCLMTVGATYQETRSWKWTLRMIVYYMGVSLIMGLLAFNVGKLLF